MSRRPRSSTKTRKGKVLARLKSEEGVTVLRALLERHPEPVAEAEELAVAAMTAVDAKAIAQGVMQAVLGLDIDVLSTRAGRTSRGYVEPTEAAWELLGEAVEPFLLEMKRHIDLGFEAAAVGTCAGLVLGLYQCRGKNSDKVLGWAEDFPAETAGHAATTLAQESLAKQRHGWRLPDAMVDQVPEWTDVIGGASRPATRRR